jgi:hypothetical protein
MLPAMSWCGLSAAAAHQHQHRQTHAVSLLLLLLVLLPVLPLQQHLLLAVQAQQPC